MELLDIAKYIVSQIKIKKKNIEEFKRNCYTSAVVNAQMFGVVLNNSFSKSKISFPPYEKVFKDENDNEITEENAFDYLVKREMQKKARSGK
jgi:hypothetical protein